MNKETPLFDRIKNNEQHVWEIIKACCHYYLRSARILGIWNDDCVNVANCRLSEWNSTYIWALMPYYNRLCARYVKEVYDPQRMLFPNERTEPDQKWHFVFQEKIFPQILLQDLFIQKLLKGIGLVTAPNPSQEIEQLDDIISRIELQKNS